MAENYKGHRIGSRKAQVREKFDDEGDEAAISFATALGLAVGTAKSWIAAWKKYSGPSDENGKVRKMGKYSGRAVRLRSDPEQKGILIEEGDEQSVVRWVNGNQVVVVNTWIEPDE